jgi:hypothetical protein
MCDASAALIVSGILQGGGQLAGAQAEAQSLKFQAGIAENEQLTAKIQGQQAEARGEERANRVRQAASQVLSQQVVATAARGVAVGGASAQELFQSTKAVGAADILQTEINTAQEVWGLKQKERFAKARKKALRKGAAQTQLLAPFTAATSILQGFGQASLLQAKTGTT